MYDRYIPRGKRSKPRGQAQWDAEAEAAARADLGQETAALRPEMFGHLCWMGFGDFWPIDDINLGFALSRLTEGDKSFAIRVVNGDAGPSDPHGYILNRRGHITDGRAIIATKRKLFRTYRKWVNNQSWCGTHGEKAVYTTLNEGHSTGRYALTTTPTSLGNEHTIEGFTLPDNRTLDVVAQVFDEDFNKAATLCVEVKNIADWIHPNSPALWQLLYGAALVAKALPKTRILPLLAAPFAHFQAHAFAADAGFLIWTYHSQLFSPTVQREEFDAVAGRLGLPAHRRSSHEPLPIRDWLRTYLRNTPSQALRGLSLSRDSTDDPPLYTRQPERFAVTAEAILAAMDDNESVSRKTGRASRLRHNEAIVFVLPWLVC